MAAAWLAGQVSGDSVRELTSGVSGALKSVKPTRAEKERLRAEAVDVLLPVAQEGTPAEVKRAVSRLRLLAESAFEEDAVDQAAVEAVKAATAARAPAAPSRRSPHGRGTRRAGTVGCRSTPTSPTGVWSRSASAGSRTASPAPPAMGTSS